MAVSIAGANTVIFSSGNVTISGIFSIYDTSIFCYSNGCVSGTIIYYFQLMFVMVLRNPPLLDHFE